VEKKLQKRMPKTWDDGERNDGRCTSNLFCQLVFTVSPSCHILSCSPMVPSFEQTQKVHNLSNLVFFRLGRRGEGGAFFMPILCGSLCAFGGVVLSLGWFFTFKKNLQFQFK